MLRVAANENVFNDANGIEFDGHYADDVTLSIGRFLVIDDPCSLWGNIDEYDAIYVIDGGSIVVPDAVWDDANSTWIGGYLMLEADTIYIDANSTIHADGCGFSSDDGHSDGGPGKGLDNFHDSSGFETLLSADGAGHGGRGATTGRRSGLAALPTERKQPTIPTWTPFSARRAERSSGRIGRTSTRLAQEVEAAGTSASR